ncbi:hypothetical protein H5410_059614 [Solanum commersonii]|uniref:Uncharacterized protein n=1 Tax=Solanum commersonii TaxID=4109 RepID=A0A9J5W3G5_SOLCO|nr:hypothetical protein H5410_059614 [Solanum commersonii]
MAPKCHQKIDMSSLKYRISGKFGRHKKIKDRISGKFCRHQRINMSSLKDIVAILLHESIYIYASAYEHGLVPENMMVGHENEFEIKLLEEQKK